MRWRGRSSEYEIHCWGCLPTESGKCVEWRDCNYPGTRGSLPLRMVFKVTNRYLVKLFTSHSSISWKSTSSSSLQFEARTNLWKVMALLEVVKYTKRLHHIRISFSHDSTLLLHSTERAQTFQFNGIALPNYCQVICCYGYYTLHYR